MATDLVSKQQRKPLHTTPTESFTLKREEHRAVEDIRLISHFAQWLSDVTGIQIGPDTLPEDLLDGVALCKLMSMISGSGVEKYHPAPLIGGALDAFKARENMTQFTNACARLSLPVSFGTKELEVGNLALIASTLVFVAHTAAVQNIGREQMDAELRARVASVSQATASLEEVDRSKVSGGAGLANPPSLETPAWWQQLLLRFGMQDLADFDSAKLRAYAASVRANLELRAANLQEEAKSKTDSFRVQMGERKQTLQDKIAEQTSVFRDHLPESLKSRLP